MENDQNLDLAMNRLSGKRVLVTAEFVANRTYLEFEKADTEGRFVRGWASVVTVAGE